MCTVNHASYTRLSHTSTHCLLAPQQLEPTHQCEPARPGCKSYGVLAGSRGRYTRSGGSTSSATAATSFAATGSTSFADSAACTLDVGVSCCRLAASSSRYACRLLVSLSYFMYLCMYHWKDMCCCSFMCTECVYTHAILD